MQSCKSYLIVVIVLISAQALAQNKTHNFRIRTITAGITLDNLSDTVTFLKAVEFLERARKEYLAAGYEVQTLRISTQDVFLLTGRMSLAESIPYLITLDKIAQRHNLVVAIGSVLAPDHMDATAASWASELIKNTSTISFSLQIATKESGVLHNSIKSAAEIAIAISKTGSDGEGNFRFTASANCPAGIPFFPAAFHQGPNSFALGLESPGLLKNVFSKSSWENAARDLRAEMEQQFKPLETLAMKIAKTSHWTYDGLDTSPAPGLEASIGEAIETLTGQPFGDPSTLRACALITGVLKGLNLKTCGYSGLMLPVIEDRILAQRAQEGRVSMQELLLFSSVSGTGLDVVPLPGDTPQQVLERIYEDVAALSLKYTNKALSARLFLIPGKKAGDAVTFSNPYLTPSIVLSAE